MRPTVIMKAAMTLDGQLAAVDGTSQWITSPEARLDAHECRASVDAIMVGAGTVIADDPLLTVRLDAYDGAQPTPVIVAGWRDLPPGSKVFSRDPIVLTARSLDVPGRAMLVPDASGSRVDLGRALELLYEVGIRSLLVEGGAGLLSALLDAGLIDRGIVYYGQKLAGGAGLPLFRGTWTTLGDALPVRFSSVREVGGDVRVEFDVVRDE